MMPLTLPAGSARQRAQAGVTLLEMLVVISILALVVAAVPMRNFTALNTVELKNLGRVMAGQLRKAQMTAKATGTATAIVFDVEARTFGETITLAEDVAIAFETSQEDALSGGIGQIIFMPDGSSNGGRITLARAGQSISITTHWLTGMVDVRDNG